MNCIKGVIVNGKKDFYQAVKISLINGGFEKIKSKFYRKSKDFLCEINIQKSNYGDHYYINLHFYIGNFERPYTIIKDVWETRDPFLFGRLRVDDTDKECFKYKKYSQEQVESIVLRNLNEWVYPAFEIGKAFLLQNLNVKFMSMFDIDEAIQALS